MSTMASPKSSMPSQTHTGTKLPGYFPNNAPFTERDLESESAPTETSRAFRMLGSTLQTVVNTASAAMWIVPLAMVASSFAPASVRNAAISAVSSVGSKIPKGAITDHLSSAASYALNHLPAYDTAVTLSKIAVGYKFYGMFAEKRRAAKEAEEDAEIQKSLVALRGSIGSLKSLVADFDIKVEDEAKL